ncbi:MAG: DUF6288 domain-containing protein [Lentisphaeria bacterium]|nr:DUF6288 domain-containing protein [Lentisphaeria bacterium]
MNLRRLTITAGVLLGMLKADIALAKSKGAERLLLGPTGIMGDVTKTSIIVDSAQPGSPADGKLTKGEEIIGVGGAKFTDVKGEMAAAIDVAESDAPGGKMALMLKGGRTVDISLPVLGSYSPTAPWDCAKSDKIIAMTAESVVKSLASKRKKEDGSRLHPELLGLMATGEKKYIDAVARAIQEESWAHPDPAKVDKVISGEDEQLFLTWYWGYNLITLAEYHLLTGDKSVLPAIRIYALALARGQDAGGLYGHRFISPERFNRLPGYAQMNQPSLSCFMGMILAKKCFVDDPVLDQAIATTNAYVSSHVGKGCFPYGVHGPNSSGFNNNGTSGSAALCMRLLGNTEGAKYFSRITATTYDGLETGHGSSFFNPLWTPLGANLSGPEVSQQFFRKSLWYFNLRRNFDGNWSPDQKPGPEEGVALLTYCLPRKALIITGREVDESIWAKGQAATDVIMLSKIDYSKKTPEELMELVMHHPLPQIRRGGVGHLGTHRDALESTWIKYLKEGTPEQKQLAISQYGWWHPIEKRLPQLDDIGAILRDPAMPLDVRIDAAGSLAYMGDPARKYYPDIVRLINEDKPDDPFQLADMGIGKNLNVLCPTPFASGLVPDKAAHYQAALKLIRHKRQNGRTEGLQMLRGLPLEDFHLVADDVLHVIADDDPTYHSYHNPSGPIAEAIAILADLKIKEGLDYAMLIGKNPSGKGSFRAKATWESLAAYGGNAKDALEQYRERTKNRTDWGRHTRAYNAMVKAVEGDKNPPKLITLEEAIQAGKGKD